MDETKHLNYLKEVHKDIKSIKSAKNFKEIDKILSENFINSEKKIGDKIILTHNPCNITCGCFWDKNKANFLQKNVVYEIEHIIYFGGGCPPVFLQLKNVKETFENNNWGVPANWFKIIN